jgi:poly(3-hydroxybutyrate) depolymerase
MLPHLDLLSILLSLVPISVRQEPARPDDVLVVRDWLVLEPVDVRGRRPFRPDAVFARYLLAPDEASPPVAGEEMHGEIEGKTAAWAARAAAEDGTLDVQGSAWAYGVLEVAEKQVRLLEARGATTVFVDGVACAGDVYSYVTPAVPVVLRAGRNEIYATGLRGLSLRLRSPARAIDISAQDFTLPDLVRGERPAGALGVVLVCAQEAPSGALRLEASGPSLTIAPLDLAEGLAPLAVRKVALTLSGGAVDIAEDSVEIELVLRRASGEELARTRVRSTVRAPGTLRQSTYVSEVDGAALAYALVPPSGEPRAGMRGLVLSLHGAGVTALGQASCYEPKPDFWIVAPENRRPYGFDWQDWGRRDAYDVLDLALARSGADPARVCVTGHSMGGHGTWHLAANDPDRFAACAPSAGWESFDSYGGRPEGTRAALWQAADGASRTKTLAANFRTLPTFVLHGSADDNVPLSEALAMTEALAGVGATFDVHVEGGAGHWWGNRCVDWPGIFELFAGAHRPDDLDRIDWTSIDPGVDSKHWWLRVEQPLEYGKPFRVQASALAEENKIRITTENVRFVAVERATVSLELDGTSFGGTEDPLGRPPYLFTRAENIWQRSHELDPPAQEKSALRSGPFKRAFDRRFVLVIGTLGDASETSELLARARHDAEQWWYRGNGNAEILTDTAFLAGGFEHRDVILYGNRDTNAAWTAVLDEDCPIQARRGSIQVGETVHEGPALGAVFVRPRKGEREALVGVFADSGPRGTRVGLTLTPFVSGVGYPDWAVFDERVLTLGDGGVIDAGWFDHAWR